MNLNKENMKKIKQLILFTIFVLVALWNYKALITGIKVIGRVILPFVIGGGIAFVLNAPMHFIEKKIFGNEKIKKKAWTEKISRPVSFILTLIFVIGILSLIVFVVVPELGKTIVNLGKTMQDFIPKAQSWAVKMFDDHPELVKQIKTMNFDWGMILERFIDFFRSGAGNVLDSTYAAAKSIVSGVYTFFIAFVFACYILLQKERLGIQVKKLMYAFMPKDWVDILLALGSVTHKTFTSFLTGQCLEAVILGGMFFVVLSIFRIPYALLISILIMFTALIPIFGAFIGCGVGTLLIFMINPIKALIFIGIFLVLQQIEGNFIYPHVVGSSVGLPSIWVLVAVSVGASLMGVVGMLIFIPIVSVIYTLLKGIVNRRLKEKEIDIV